MGARLRPRRRLTDGCAPRARRAPAPISATAPRSQRAATVVASLLVIATLGLAACRGDAEPDPTSGGESTGGESTGGESASGTGSAAEPGMPGRLSAPPAAVPDDPMAALDAILARCHGPRRGGFDRVLLQWTPPDEPVAWTVLARLPDAMRISTDDGRNTLVVGPDVTTWQGDAPAAAFDGPDADRLRTFRDALDLITLQPLERAEQATRTSPDRITFDAGGRSYELTHDGDAPRRLATEGVAIDFVEFHTTPTTRVPLRVAIDDHGTHETRFQDTGIDFPADTFAPPSAATTDAEPRIDVSGAPGSSPPQVVELAPIDWLLFPDPGDWDGRVDALLGAAERLGDAGYTGGGDPVLTTRDGRDWFALPFLPGPDDPDTPPVGDDERLVQRPRTRLAQMELPDGPFDARVATGRDRLAAWCEDRGLKVTGPLEVVVNIRGHDPRAELRAAERLLVTLRYPVAGGDGR